MSSLQEFSDMQEMEFHAAVSDIKNAIAKFGIEIVNAAILDGFVSEGIHLTKLATDDTLVTH